MARLWVALAMVVALAGTALAKRDPACTCAASRVLPAPGSVGVPTNARLWRLPATSAPDERSAVGKQRVTLRSRRWLVNRARYHGVPKATL